MTPQDEQQSHRHQLTTQEEGRVDEFKKLFTEIEARLKQKLRLKPNDTTSVSQLIDRYARQNPAWTHHADELHCLRGVRNIVTHQWAEEHGYPVALPSRTLERLTAVLEQLANPPQIGTKFTRNVATVAHTDTLDTVLRVAVENGFSQFPVLMEARFIGLLTENGVTRWLGRQARAGACQIDLQRFMVQEVLEEEEPERKGRCARFQSPEAPEFEVMSQFQVYPDLEVVLLTTDGTSKTPIVGIVTQWDAARYFP